ncbi:MAG: LemA family protein [Actinomycetota bacterium]|jgi:LemA protein|nr:LemA family protein [Actinomycetota bacterium]
MTGWILLGVVVALVLGLVVLAHGLTTWRRRVDAAWTQIEVQLRRRHELVPAVIEVAARHAGSERDLLERLARARTAALDARGVAEQAGAERALGAALASLSTSVAARPDLEADQGFLSLQEELSGIEGRVAYARRFYNDTVASYNARIRSFPSLLLARPLRLGARERFEVDDGSREPAVVSS